MPLDLVTRPQVLDGEILPPGEGGISVLGAAHPFRTEQTALEVPPGLTVQEILDLALMQAGVKPGLAGHVHVMLERDGQQWEVDRRYFRQVRPKPGTNLLFRVAPKGGGGGGKNPLRTMLMLAVTVAALVAAPYIAGPAVMGFATGSTGFAIASGIVGAGITLVGTMLVNAIAPPRLPELSTSSNAAESPTYRLAGARNVANHFGPVPSILGRHRVHPNYGAMPYTEMVGQDQYLRMLFVFGYGPLAIEDIRIGETPITDFTDWEMELRGVEWVGDGPPPGTILEDGDPFTLYPGQVIETEVGVVLSEQNVWVTRTSQENVDELSVDLDFPQGLVHFNQEGKRRDRSVDIEVEYRPVGGGAWTQVLQHTYRERSAQPLRFGHRWKVARGQYEVRVRRTSAPSTSDRNFDTVQWAVLRSIRDEDPVKFEKPLAALAIRIKASEQLTGVIDSLNAICTTIALDYHNGSWSARPTTNPASLYRHVLQGPANARPRTNDQIDLPALEAWHQFCEVEGFKFNHVRDFDASVWSTLADIASAGRAAPAILDGRWGVVMDGAGKPIVQHITPRNSWGFSAERVYRHLPHGWRVRFISEENGWNHDERIVYDDGYDESNATLFEGLELPGVTDPDLVWRHGRYHIASARLRPEVFSWNMDFEHIVFRRGDLVRVTHDVTMWGLGSARVKEVLSDGGLTTGIVLDDELPAEAGKDYAVRVRRQDGASWVRSVVNPGGTSYALTFKTPVAEAQGPQVGDLVLFGEEGQESVELLIRSIEPSGDLTARVTGIDYAPEIYLADQGAIPPYDPQITRPPDLTEQAPEVPRIIGVVTGSAALQNGREEGRIIVRVAPFSGAIPVRWIETRHRLRGSEDSWTITRADAEGQTVVIRDVEVSDDEETVHYDIAARSVSPWGVRSAWSDEVGTESAGDDIPPGPVTNLRTDGGWNQIALQWDNPPDPDLDHVEIWEAAEDDRAVASRIAQVSGTSYVRTGLQGRTVQRWYWARAVDAAGNVGPWNAVNGTHGVTELLDENDLADSIRDLMDDLDLHAIEPVYELPGPGSPLREDGKLVLFVPEKKIYRWDDGAGEWVPLIADIEEGQVRAIHIAANTIGQTHFADGLTPVGIVNGLPDPSEWDGPQIVTNEQDGKLYQIVDGEWQPVIADLELEDGMIENRHILDGAIDELKLAANAVTAAKIATGAVLEEKLANDAITAEKIRANAISTDHLQDELITAEKLVANAVTAAKIAANAVTQQKLANAAVRARHIAQGAVDATKFASGISAPEVKSALPTTGNFEGRLVFLETDGKLYRFHAGEWTAAVPTTDLSGLIEGSQLVDEAITAVKLAEGAVEASKIKTGAVLAEKLAEGAVIAGKIAANAISTENLQDELITAEKIVAEAVTRVKIAGEAIDASKLANNAVTTAKVAANAINAGKIASNAVQARQIQANAVTTAKLADEAVQAAKLAANAVTQEKLADAAVTASKIAEGAIEASKFAAGISAPQIVSALPTSGNFEGRIVFLTTDGKLYRYHSGAWTSAVPTADLSGLIQTEQLVDEAITAVKIATDAIDSSKIKDSAITAAKVAANAIEAGKIAANAVNSDQIAANAVTTAKLVNNAVNAAKIAANAVTQAKIANNAVTARQIADGVIGAAKFASDIAAPQIVSSLPTSGNYEGRLVVYQGELHRYHNGSWTTAVAAVDITGQLTNEQIAEIEAAKLTGQITEVQIKDNAISAPKLAAGSVVSDKVAANAIVAAKIASNAVQTRQIQANAVVAGKIASNAIEARHIVANSITAGAIAAGAVGADQIAANAITSDKIAANAITARELVIGDFTNLIPNGSFDTDAPAGWEDLPSHWSIVPREDAPSPYALRMPIVDGSAHAVRVTGDIPCSPGDQFLLSCVARAEGGEGSSVFQMYARYVLSDGSVSNQWGNMGSAPSTGFELMSRVSVAPADAAFVSFRVRRHISDGTGMTVFATNFQARRITPGVLIQDGAITAEKVSANAINANHLAANSVTASQIAANAVTASQLAANAVKAVNIEANAVTTAKIAANAVTTNEIAANAVKAAQIDAGAVTSNKIAANAVVAGKIDTGAVTADTIATNAVTAAKISANAVTAAKIASNAVQARQIQANAVNADKIAANSVGTDHLIANSVTAGIIAAGAVGADQIAANAITADKIAADAISAKKLVISDFTNLLEEPAFNKSGIGWNLGNNSIVETPNQVSSYALRMAAGGNGSTVTNNNDAIPVTPGDQLLLVVEAFPLSSPQGRVRIRGRSLNKNGSQVKADVIDLDETTPGGRRRYTTIVTAHEEAETVQVDLLNQLTSGEFRISYVGLHRMTTGELIVDGAVTAEKVSANAINASHIATNSITADHLSANSVTASQLAANAVKAVNIEANAVTTAKIAANAVTTNEIAANAVKAAQIDAGAVTTGALAAGAVTSEKIEANAVTAREIAANAVTATQIAANAVVAATIAANAVTTQKLAANAVTAAKIAANTITAAQIATNTITGDLLVANAITTREIAVGAVTADQISANAVTAAKIATNAVTAAKIQANAVVAAKVATNAIESRHVLANNITAAKIASNAIETRHLKADAITAGKIAAGAVGADQIAANAITSDKIAAGAVTAKKLVIGDFTNLVEEPSFLLDGAGWDLGGRSVIGVGQHPTGRALQVVPGSNFIINNNDSFPALPGDKFLLVAEVAKIGTVVGNIQIRARFANISGGHAGNTAITLDESVGAGWQRYTAEVVAPAEAATGRVDIHCANFTGGEFRVAYVALHRMTTGELIVDGAITAEKITANAINSSHIAANAIAANHISANAVGADQISANAVTTQKLAANAVTAAKIAAGTITGNEIAANTIAGGKLIANTISTREIAASAVKAAQIDAGAVTAGKIAAGAVNASNILTNNIVVTDKINANAVTAAKIASNAVQARQIQANAVNADKIAANSILTGHISAGAVNTSQLAANAITSDKIAANAITAKQIAIGDFENICKNPQFRDGTADGWDTFPSQWSIISRDPNAPHNAIRTAPTAHFVSIPADGATRTAWVVRDLPIKPGERFYFSVDRAASGSGSVLAGLRLRRIWRDAEGNEVSSANTNFNATSTSWQTFEAEFATSNTDAATVDIAIQSLSGGTNTGYFTNLRIYKMTPSTLIENGAITTEKVAANAITANKLAADSVTAGAIAAGAVNTAALAANAVAANKIASNAIQTRHLTAGSIRSQEIAANTIRANNIYGSAVNDVYSVTTSSERVYKGNSSSTVERTKIIGSFTTSSDGQGRIFYWIARGRQPSRIIAEIHSGLIKDPSVELSIILGGTTVSTIASGGKEITGVYGYRNVPPNTLVEFEVKWRASRPSGGDPPDRIYDFYSTQVMVLECKR